MKTLGLGFALLILLTLFFYQSSEMDKAEVLSLQTSKTHWLLLHRKSNKEYLYFGKPGNKSNSALVKVFNVKTGMPSQRPTPLPELLGEDYWLIIDKYEESENPETAPYFLTLNIPVSENPPYGPQPYLECNGQCNWELPGAFGLHGNNGDPEKLATSNPGSSGCIRHSVEDITYLYNLLAPDQNPVRYYIEDV